MRESKTITGSLEHVILYPAEKKDSYPTIIALHGRGTDANDLLPLTESLGRNDVLVVAPRAPLPLDLAFSQGYAWYDLGQEGVPHPQTFLASLELLRRFIAEVKAGYPVDLERLILLGFSQGTVMAYAAGLMEPKSIHGIVALSGYIPHKSGLPLQLRDLQSLAVFISHGSYDQIIPVQFGRESADLLKRAGAAVGYHEYPMEHEVRQETLRDLAAWTHHRLS